MIDAELAIEARKAVFWADMAPHCPLISFDSGKTGRDVNGSKDKRTSYLNIYDSRYVQVISPLAPALSAEFLGASNIIQATDIYPFTPTMSSIRSGEYARDGTSSKILSVLRTHCKTSSAGAIQSYWYCGPDDLRTSRYVTAVPLRSGSLIA